VHEEEVYAPSTMVLSNPQRFTKSLRLRKGGGKLSKDRVGLLALDPLV